MANAIKVVAQYQIPVFSLLFTAVQADDGYFFVSLDDVFQGLKLNPAKESKHLQHHTILKEGYGLGQVLTNDGTTETRELLRIDLLALWVTNMPVDHLEEPLKTSVVNFQREAAYVLQEGLVTGKLNDQGQMADLLRREWPQVASYKKATNNLMIARAELLAEARSQRLQEIYNE